MYVNGLLAIITAITAAASIVTAISTTITARIQKHASRKQLIIEVLNKVVIPLLNKLKIMRSKCQKKVGTPGSLSISTLRQSM